MLGWCSGSVDVVGIFVVRGWVGGAFGVGCDYGAAAVRFGLGVYFL